MVGVERGIGASKGRAERRKREHGREERKEGRHACWLGVKGVEGKRGEGNRTRRNGTEWNRTEQEENENRTERNENRTERNGTVSQEGTDKRVRWGCGV